MDTLFDVSIIIPAKDEEQRLPAFLADVITYSLRSRLRYEIIVVDDGSSDQTFQAASSFRRRFPKLQVLRHEPNRGKGYAVRQGLLASRGRVALFLDADGSTPASEIEKHLPYFDQGYDIVIGSRVLPDNGRRVQAKFYRKCMGTLFNFCVRSFLISGIQDTQCGFKLFRREVVLQLWPQVHLEGFGFDLEVLYLARQMGYRIKEVPVNWSHVNGSKIRMLHDSWGMLANIFQIRRLHQGTLTCTLNKENTSS